MAVVSFVIVGSIAAFVAWASIALGAPVTAIVLVYYAIGLLGLGSLATTALRDGRAP